MLTDLFSFFVSPTSPPNKQKNNKEKLITDRLLENRKCTWRKSAAVSDTLQKMENQRISHGLRLFPWKGVKDWTWRRWLGAQLNHSSFPELIIPVTHGCSPRKTNLSMLSPSILCHSRSCFWIIPRSLIIEQNWKGTSEQSGRRADSSNAWAGDKK